MPGPCGLPVDYSPLPLAGEGLGEREQRWICETLQSLRSLPPPTLSRKREETTIGGRAFRTLTQPAAPPR